jgi:DNA-binding transcriptional regulator GbsR (MarR family)
MAYDETLTDVIVEEFIRTRIVNLLKKKKKVANLDDITESLGEDRSKVLGSLSEMSKEGVVSRIFKDRVPYYVIG